VDERAGEVNLDSEYHPRVITDRTGDVRAHKPSNGSIALIVCGIGEKITAHLRGSVKGIIESTLDTRLAFLILGHQRTPTCPHLHEALRSLIQDEVI
jgi:hypothetical protein